MAESWLGNEHELERLPAALKPKPWRASEAIVNDPQKAGITRAIEAAWDYLPQLLIAAVVALTVFLFGLWLGYRDLRSITDGVATEQLHERLCQRISGCAICEKLVTAVTDARVSLISADQHIESHNREAEQWKQRIIRLEQQVYEQYAKPQRGMQGPP